MGKIKQLSEEVVAKIAAGEVIERPAYAVKEIIENSLDAGATEITVILKENGLKNITITDNGEGMTKEDIRECFKPHTTSKISTEHDLHTIHSMGFRGEALWSIAAISKLTIKSKTKDDLSGTVVELTGGQLETIAPVGMDRGTAISIDNIFSTVPARYKFLKSGTTELRHVLSHLISLSLANPSVSFSVSNNGKELLNLPKNQTIESRIQAIYTADTYKNLIPVSYQDNYVEIHGFIQKPQLESHQLRQILFVNKRLVEDKQVALAIKNAYGTLLEPKVIPSYILFLTIPSERIDVNVHPRKEQVAFVDSKFIYESFQNAVIDALSKSGAKYEDHRWKRSWQEDETDNYPDKLTRSYSASVLRENINPWSVYGSDKNEKNTSIIQIHNLYIITQTSKGLLMIDQHAAHERILYEQFLEEFKKQQEKKELYTLKNPQKIELTIQESLAIEENLETLKELGFELETKNETIFIKKVPMLYKDRDISEILREVLHDLEDDQLLKEVDTKTHKMLSFLACRTAIKAGDRLTKEQSEKLLVKLFQTQTQYTCPHGRPVQVEITLNELHRLFKRQ